MSIVSPLNSTTPNTPITTNMYTYACTSQHSLPEASTSYLPYHKPATRSSLPLLDASFNDAAQRRRSRPLPRIPQPVPSSTRSSPTRPLRPLPTPPPRAQSFSEPERHDSPVRSRPLPRPGTSPSRLGHEPQPSPRVTTAHLDEHAAARAPLSAPPCLSLMVPAYTGTQAPGSDNAQTPDSLYLSPVVFAGSEPIRFTPTDTEAVAKRLSTLGFVEVCSPVASSPTEWPCPWPDLDQDAVSANSACLPPPATPNIEFRIELISPPKAGANAMPVRQASRFWVREKKGKRWVESDHDEILQELRKL